MKEFILFLTAIFLSGINSFSQIDTIIEIHGDTILTSLKIIGSTDSIDHEYNKRKEEINNCNECVEIKKSYIKFHYIDSTIYYNSDHKIIRILFSDSTRLKKYFRSFITITKEYYPNGQIKHIEYRPCGEKYGIEEIWYENGQKQRQTEWKDGKKDGLDIFWKEDGDLGYINTYKNNVTDGPQCFFEKKGQILGNESYKDGFRNGESIIYDKGKLWAHGYYINGTGYSIYFDKDGKIEKKYYSKADQIYKIEHFDKDGFLYLREGLTDDMQWYKTTMKKMK